MKACPPLANATVTLLAVILLTGCHESFAPISSHITAEEMHVYETWLQHRKLHFPEEVIQVSPTTLPIPLTEAKLYRLDDHDGLRRFDGERKSLMHDGVSADAIAKVERLGDAAYPLSTPLDPRIATYSDHYSCSKTLVGGINGLASFSRIAFSRNGQTAFLHIHYSECRTLAIENGAAPDCECGGGFSQYLLATKQGNDWSFKGVGPVGID